MNTATEFAPPPNLALEAPVYIKVTIPGLFSNLWRKIHKAAVTVRTKLTDVYERLMMRFFNFCYRHPIATYRTRTALKTISEMVLFALGLAVFVFVYIVFLIFFLSLLA